jgi:hypothetical protein
MSCPHCCTHSHVSVHRARGSGAGFSLVGTIFKLLLVYVGLIFAGGTLINTGHPVATETGRLIHTITFIEPAIHWTQTHGWYPLAMGLETLASGMRFS